MNTDSVEIKYQCKLLIFMQDAFGQLLDRYLKKEN